MAVESSLKELRKQRKETQKDLAVAIGVDSKTIRNIERSGTCSLEVALRLSAYLKLSVNKIFTVADLTNKGCDKNELSNHSG